MNGLHVHPTKTKLLTWNYCSFGCKQLKIWDITFDILGEHEAERYLGRKFCMLDCHSTELQNRVAAGWAKFHSFRSELTGKGYSVKSRVRLFEAIITTTVLHGSCTWALTCAMAATLDAVRRKMLRLVLRILGEKLLIKANCS